MLNAKFKPILAWPGKPTASYSRKNARFSVSYNRTLSDLEAELNKIYAKNIIVQLYIRRDEIRNDGWPRATARPSGPGVILTFQRGNQVVSMPCDTFKTWEQNLRAISLTLHLLRMIDQYNVGSNGQQYSGFAQIEPPAQVNQRDVAVHFVAKWAGVSNQDVINDLDGACRLAARKLHPDAGGSHELFIELQKHQGILRAK